MEAAAAAAAVVVEVVMLAVAAAQIPVYLTAALRDCHPVNHWFLHLLQVPNTEQWKNKARQFELLWNFPHCIGSINGKHIVIEAPFYSGSDFFNNKE